MAEDKGSVYEHWQKKKIHILLYVSFTVNSSYVYRSLVDQMDDAQVSYVISNKKVSKVTVKTEWHCWNQ